MIPERGKVLGLRSARLTKALLSLPPASPAPKQGGGELICFSTYCFFSSCSSGFFNLSDLFSILLFLFFLGGGEGEITWEFE